MSIEIRCMKCGKVSSSPYTFGRKRISYCVEQEDGSGLCPTDHLCASCQADMDLAINRTVAEFLGVDNVYRWKLEKGIVL